MSYYLTQFDALEEGFKVNLDIRETLKQLRSLTRIHRSPRPGTNHSGRLFGQDLLSTVNILKRSQKIFKEEKGNKSMAKESVGSFTETASNVLDLENHETWMEIDEVTIIL